MLQTLMLLLPALIPSWRFFDNITLSPRIEFTLLKTTDDISESWLEFLPKPTNVSIVTMLKSLIWNPRGNEYLFLISCAERLITNPTEQDSLEILNRIKAEAEHKNYSSMDIPYLQFRLVFYYQEGDRLRKKLSYISKIYGYSKNGDLWN